MLMKKNRLMRLVFAIVAVASLAMIPPAKASARVITIYVEDQILEMPDAEPFVQNGRVMVPFRPLAEALGCKEATWDPKHQRVTIAADYVAYTGKWFPGTAYFSVIKINTKVHHYIEFLIGSTAMNSVGSRDDGYTWKSTITLDQPAVLVNGNRAFVPLRAFCEAMACSLEWKPETNTAYIHFWHEMIKE